MYVYEAENILGRSVKTWKKTEVTGYPLFCRVHFVYSLIDSSK